MATKESQPDRAEKLDTMIFAGHVWLDDDEDAGQIVFAVNCNDLWAWGSADQEEIPYSEIERCYQLGPITWACVRRNLRPFDQREEAMKKLGTWNDALEALPKREDTKP